MAGFSSMKMKRKDFEDVYDEFSEFSLSSPARKIRRLDADLPPIMEEEEAANPGQTMPEEHLNISTGQLAAGMEEATPSFPLNEERALVLYKPVNTPLLQSSNSSNMAFTVNTDLIPGFKNHSQCFWTGHRNVITEAEEDEASMDGNPSSNNRCLAVVPWVPSQPPVGDWQCGSRLSEPMEPPMEPMETEEAGAATMEIEEEYPAGFGDGGEVRVSSGGMGGGEGIQQWHQQHCMTPQIPIPHKPSTPVMWSW